MPRRKRKKNAVHSNCPPSPVTTRKMTADEIAEFDKTALKSLKSLYGKYNLNDHYNKEYMPDVKAQIEVLERKSDCD